MSRWAAVDVLTARERTILAALQLDGGEAKVTPCGTRIGIRLPLSRVDVVRQVGRYVEAGDEIATLVHARVDGDAVVATVGIAPAPRSVA